MRELQTLILNTQVIDISGAAPGFFWVQEAIDLRFEDHEAAMGTSVLEEFDMYRHQHQLFRSSPRYYGWHRTMFYSMNEAGSSVLGYSRCLAPGQVSQVDLMHLLCHVHAGLKKKPSLDIYIFWKLRKFQKTALVATSSKGAAAGTCYHSSIILLFFIAYSPQSSTCAVRANK